MATFPILVSFSYFGTKWKWYGQECDFHWKYLLLLGLADVKSSSFNDWGFKALCFTLGWRKKNEIKDWRRHLESAPETHPYPYHSRIWGKTVSVTGSQTPKWPFRCLDTVAHIAWLLTQGTHWLHQTTRIEWSFKTLNMTLKGMNLLFPADHFVHQDIQWTFVGIQSYTKVVLQSGISPVSCWERQNILLESSPTT